MKQCPYCAEEIQDQAIVCRYCGRELGHPTPDDREDEVLHWPAVTKSHPASILLVVLASGALPASWNLTLFTGISRSAYVTVYFLVHLLGLAFGVIAALLWRGRHPAGNIVLALLAGAVEAVAIWVVLTNVSINGLMLEAASEDYIAVAGTVLLFIAGALFGERIERRRAEMHAAGSTGHVLGAASPGSGRRPVELTSLFSTANSFLGLAGTVVSLVAAVQKL